LLGLNLDVFTIGENSSVGTDEAVEKVHVGLAIPSTGAVVGARAVETS
jgi:hypothetical protein